MNNYYNFIYTILIIFGMYLCAYYIIQHIDNLADSIQYTSKGYVISNDEVGD